jgi:hypothetical protein
VLYLVGGASRAGKSLLARRLLCEQGIPYFSLDILMMGMANGWPAFGLSPDAPDAVNGERLWPIVCAMAVNILEEAVVHPTYLLEGVQLLPGHVAELVQSYSEQVRACFLGYTVADPAEKYAAIRAQETDWMRAYSDAQNMAFLSDEVAFSRALQRDCLAHGLRYLDVSTDLLGTVAEASRYLLQP